MGNRTTYSVRLSFEKAQLPPFSDILLLGRKSPIGIAGITKSLEFLVPNNFDVISLDDDIVEAMVINRAIVRRMPVERVVALLREHVLPFMSETEMIRVDFAVRVTHEALAVE